MMLQRGVAHGMLELRTHRYLVSRSALAHGVVPTLAASGAALAVTVLRAGLAADAAVLSRILALLKVALCANYTLYHTPALAWL